MLSQDNLCWNNWTPERIVPSTINFTLAKFVSDYPLEITIYVHGFNKDYIEAKEECLPYFSNMIKWISQQQVYFFLLNVYSGNELYTDSIQKKPKVLTTNLNNSLIYYKSRYSFTFAN
jgi:hypothetical protein